MRTRSLQSMWDRIRGPRAAALILVLLVSVVPVASADDPPWWPEGCTVEWWQEQEIMICVPPNWDPDEDGDLVVFAHGYVAFNEPAIAIPRDQLVLPDGTSIPELINGLGYAFATTSYRVNGLAIREGLQDLVDLVSEFGYRHGEPRFVYLAGASEGGLITALAIERYPDVFDGGLSTCGPVGSFCAQINYWGDVRVLFDYFFPGVLPGSPVDIPPELIENWDTRFADDVRDALTKAPGKTAQLLNVSGVPVDAADPNSGIEALVQVLWYNVFATTDGRAKLRGQPYSNIGRWYRGSSNDWLLNRSVVRIRADWIALKEIDAHYQTSGDLQAPLVLHHTLRDPVVPYWHEPLYRLRVAAQGRSALHSVIPSLRYGHCNFSRESVLASFALLVYQVTGRELPGVDLPVPDVNGEYWTN